MHALAATGGGFLLAVLWFDLMFDVQVRRHDGDSLPSEVLVSISRYYRRVTTDAAPMNRLVALAMLVTLAAVAVNLLCDRTSLWIDSACLALTLSAIGLAAARTVRNAVRLGRSDDSPAVQSQLARGIYRDHVWCFAAMSLHVALQLAVCLAA